MTNFVPHLSPLDFDAAIPTDDRPFPIAFERTSPSFTFDETLEWIAADRAELLDLVASSGVLLLRGLPLQTAEDFDLFLRAIDLPPFAYEDSLSNAYRISFTDRVFSANEAPPEVPIFLHHEMAQTPLPPSRLFFFCAKAPLQGGATPVCRSDMLWQRLEAEQPEFAGRCEREGLRYSNVMPESEDLRSTMGRSWRSTFGAETRREAEARMTDLGYAWSWQNDGSLRATTPCLPAVHTLADGRKTFFNQLIAATQGWEDSRNDRSQAVLLGDGSPPAPEGLMAARRISDELTFDISWKEGDVAIVDNYLAMHGRRPFRGTRSILASLVSA